MKKIFNLLFVALLLTVVFTSCDDDESTDDGPTETSNLVVEGAILESTTWTADRIYELRRKVIVGDGITLTIEPGTIIKGQPGQDDDASALIIARGGKLMAVGTATQPIIFTASEDNIEIGQTAGTNLTKTDNEKWGGVIILGNSIISAEDGDAESNIEGIDADLGFGKFGGTNNADNSGTLNYVSIRHGGISIGSDNEINGLTLGGVGTGTTLTNIEVYATLDDGVEFFGGSVNASNVLVHYQGDDGIDIDMNYSGTVDNFMVVHGAGIGTDEGLEIDGPEATANDGLFTLINGTVKTDDAAEGSAADLKSKAQGTLSNVAFSGYETATLKVRYSSENFCADVKTDAYTNLVDAGTLDIELSSFDGISVYTGSTNTSDGKEDGDDCEVPAAAQTAAEGAAISAGATGANATAFAWTLAAQRGEL